MADRVRRRGGGVKPERLGTRAQALATFRERQRPYSHDASATSTAPSVGVAPRLMPKASVVTGGEAVARSSPPRMTWHDKPEDAAVQPPGLSHWVWPLVPQPGNRVPRQLAEPASGEHSGVTRQVPASASAALHVAVVITFPSTVAEAVLGLPAAKGRLSLGQLIQALHAIAPHHLRTAITHAHSEPSTGVCDVVRASEDLSSGVGADALVLGDGRGRGGERGRRGGPGIRGQAVGAPRGPPVLGP
jgi:hypothetical protein